MEEVELKRKILDLLKRDEEFRYAVAGLIGVSEILRRLDGHLAEMARLREDMVKGFELVERHISALGARWGLLTEEAFRQGLRGILGRELGLEVERWEFFDEEGVVYGYPSPVEVDVAVKDGRVLLIEITAHARPSDVYEFRRKAELYQRATGRRPSRLILVTPYAEESAVKASERLGIEIYTKA